MTMVDDWLQDPMMVLQQGSLKYKQPKNLEIWPKRPFLDTLPQN